MNSYDGVGKVSNIKILDSKWGKSALFKLADETTGSISCMLTVEKLISKLNEGDDIRPTNYFPKSWMSKNEATGERKFGLTMRIKDFDVVESYNDVPEHNENDIPQKQSNYVPKEEVNGDE